MLKAQTQSKNTNMGDAPTPSPAPQGRRRLSFAETLYKTMIRISPQRKPDVQSAFRFFKANPMPGHDLVLGKLIELLGHDFVQESWVEARHQLQCLQQMMLAQQQQEGGDDGGSSNNESSPSSTPSLPPSPPQCNYHEPPHYYQDPSYLRSNNLQRRVRPRLEEGTATAGGQGQGGLASILSNAFQYVGETLADDEFLTEGAPNAFVCPISLRLLTDPVVAADTHTYQREALEQWMAHNRKEGTQIRSPITNQPMGAFFTGSHTIQRMVRQYIEEKRQTRQKRKAAATTIPSVVNIASDDEEEEGEQQQQRMRVSMKVPPPQGNNHEEEEERNEDRKRRIAGGV